MENTAIIIIGTLFTFFTLLFMLGFAYLFHKKRRELELVEKNKILLLKEASYRANILAVENERSDIGQALHDQLGSDLTSCSFLLDQLKQDNVAQAERIKVIQKTQELLKNVMLKTKDISRSLYPHSLKKYGLKMSIEDLLSRYKLVEKPINTEFNFNAFRSNELIDIVIFRTVQELITNAYKHSHASKIELNIVPRKNEDISLTYTDNGQGFQKKVHPKSMGLSIMRNRIDAIGGSIDIESTEHGLRVSAIIPLSND